MADKDIILKEKLDETGIFNFSQTYAYAYNWFKAEQYGVVEEKYSEKVSGNSKELMIEWKASKRLSDYFKIEIALRWEIYNMTDVEVEIDGKKKKMNKGKLVIDLKGTLVRDPDSKWDTSAMMRFWRDVYDKYIVPNRVEALEEKTKKDLKDFKEEMKAFLELSGRI